MDIVEQLRKSANIVYEQDGYTFRFGLQNEAADEIERLRKESRLYWDAFQKAANEVERLRELIENYINEKSDLKRAMIDILEYLSAVQIAEVNIKYIARKALGEIDALKEGE